jgi:hypothetical protein
VHIAGKASVWHLGTEAYYAAIQVIEHRGQIYHFKTYGIQSRLNLLEQLRPGSEVSRVDSPHFATEIGELGDIGRSRERNRYKFDSHF